VDLAKLLGGTDVRVDVVYSNSNLGEISRVALRHILQISRQMLSGSEIGLFCYVSKGSPTQMSHEDVDEDFRIFGYHRVLEKTILCVHARSARGRKSAGGVQGWSALL
jgi:hypothetical protein